MSLRKASGRGIVLAPVFAGSGKLRRSGPRPHAEGAREAGRDRAEAHEQRVCAFLPESDASKLCVEGVECRHGPVHARATQTGTGRGAATKHDGTEEEAVGRGPSISFRSFPAPLWFANGLLFHNRELYFSQHRIDAVDQYSDFVP